MNNKQYMIRWKEPPQICISKFKTFSEAISGLHDVVKEMKRDHGRNFKGKFEIVEQTENIVYSG